MLNNSVNGLGVNAYLAAVNDKTVIQLIHISAQCTQVIGNRKDAV